MNNIKNIFILCSFFSSINNLLAQLDTVWTRAFGGSQNEILGTVLPNNMGSPGASIAKYGNYLFAVASTLSNDGDLRYNYGSEDIWVIKLNLQGDTIWTKSFGGSDYERAYKILALNDGGCVIVGSTMSNSDDFINSKGGSDGFLLRLNSNGDIVWFKRYGGSNADYLYDVILTSDGNFLCVGESFSINGDLVGTGSGLSWIIKINASNGNRIWSKTYQGPDSGSQDYLDNFFRVIELSDGSGFVAAGYTTPYFYDFDADDIHYEKIDNNGNVVWSKKIGSTMGGDAIGNIVDGGNGQFYLVGRVIGTGSIVSNYYGGSGDVWIVKCDAQGNHLWNKNWGGTDWEFAFDAKKDSLNNLYIGAFTRSTDYDAAGVSYGLQDYWFLKTDTSGNLLWKYRCGGSDRDIILGIEVLDVNSVVAIGRTFSNDGMVTLNKGGSDVWIVRVDSLNNITSTTNSHIQPLFSFYALDNQNYSLSTEEGINHIQIFNLLGNLVFEQRLINPQSNLKIPLHEASGIYILNVITDKQVYCKKFYHP